MFLTSPPVLEYGRFNTVGCFRLCSLGSHTGPMNKHADHGGNQKRSETQTVK